MRVVHTSPCNNHHLQLLFARRQNSSPIRPFELQLLARRLQQHQARQQAEAAEWPGSLANEPGRLLSILREPESLQPISLAIQPLLSMRPAAGPLSRRGFSARNSLVDRQGGEQLWKPTSAKKRAAPNDKMMRRLSFRAWPTLPGG